MNIHAATLYMHTHSTIVVDVTTAGVFSHQIWFFGHHLCPGYGNICFFLYFLCWLLLVVDKDIGAVVSADGDIYAMHKV